MTDVNPISKESQLYPGTKVLCACGCGIEGVERKKVMKDGLVHVRGCPCSRCIGSRNRSGGLVKQRRAQKGLGIPLTRFRSSNSNEESWSGLVRCEVKSGAQVMPAWRRYVTAEGQSQASTAVGDVRPFVGVLMPSGESDGLVQFRLSRLRDVVWALFNQLFEEGA